MADPENESANAEKGKEDKDEPLIAPGDILLEGAEEPKKETEEPAPAGEEKKVEAAEGPTAEEKAGAAPGEQLASVTVSDTEGNEPVFALDRPVTNAGRDEANHIAVPDLKCSRKHFTIEMAGDFYNAIDLGSTNGLRLNGHKIKQRRLRDGDEIAIGAYKIVYHGPTDTSISDDLVPSTTKAGTKIESAVEGGVSPLPEGEQPTAAVAPKVQPPWVDDSKTCPQCKTDMPETQVCAQCGHKSLKLQAIEFFVDHVAKGDSLLGGLGLWAVKRKKVLEKAQALKDVEWVIEVRCGKCHWKHHLINEWRAKCIACEGCGAEVPMPVFDPPKIE